MSLASTIGPEGNLLEETPEQCRQLEAEAPVLTNDELAKLRCVGNDDDACRSRPRVRRPAIAASDAHAPDAVRPDAGRPASSRRIAELCAAASAALEDGVNILILSDRGVDATQRGHSEPARHGRRAPPPDARGAAHAVRARRRDRRAARGAPLRAAHRLRRRRGQSVPRLRDLRRHDPAGHAARPDPREGGRPTTSRRSTRASSR